MDKKADDFFIHMFSCGRLYVHPDQFFRGRVLYRYYRNAQDVTDIHDDDTLDLGQDILYISRLTKKLFHANLINVISTCDDDRNLCYDIIPRHIDESNWGSPPWPHPTHVASNEEVTRIKTLYLDAIEGEKTSE